MRAREDYETILEATLSSGLKEFSGRAQDVQVGQCGRGQVWFLQSLFGAYHAPKPSRAVRHWLRDSFRFTSVVWRLPAQYSVGTLAALKPVLHITGRKNIWISPGIADPDSTIILPGNKRVRLLCFATRRTRTFAKSGFDSSGMQREREAREMGPGPYPQITRCAEDGSWIEEEFVDGVSLARTPPWFGRRRAVSDLLARLRYWGGEGDEESAPIRAAALATKAGDLAMQVEGRLALKVPKLLIEQLQRQAEPMRSVMVTMTHGDLQPGNVIRSPRGLVVVDWEHIGRRMSQYDVLVWAFRSRWGANWSDRTGSFVNGSQEFPFDPMPSSASWRRGALAMFCLEELVWHLEDALSGPYRAVPDGLVACLAASTRIARE